MLLIVSALSLPLVEEEPKQKAATVSVDGVITGTLSEERAILLPARLWADAKQFLTETYGKSVNIVLSKFAEEFGRAYAGRTAGMGLTPRETFDALQKMAKVAGWGEVSVSGDVEGGSSLRVDVRGCAFCAANRDPTEPCDFVAGVAVGTAKVIYQSDYVCDHVDVERERELRCTLGIRRARDSNSDWRTAVHFPWMLKKS